MSFDELERLLQTLVRLRGPEGCPWDRAQDLGSASRYLSDEVFEYVEATHRDDDDAIEAELADLLYMLSFNWLLLSERTGRPFDHLARLGADKLVRRHPTIFGNPDGFEGLEHDEIWKRVKAREKAERAEGAEAADSATDSRQDGSFPSILKDLATSASPLRQASLYGRDAAETGFDWSSPEPVVEKLHEELAELHEAIELGEASAIEEELGDVLFSVVQLGRKLEVDPDLALRRTNQKFARRFRRIESRHGGDLRRLRALGLAGLWKEWEAVKAEERAHRSSGDARA